MKRIAILVPGGIGESGPHNHIPPLVNLIRRLAEKYDITVYSFYHPPRDRGEYNCGRATVRNITIGNDDYLYRKAALLFFAFRKNHRDAPFDLVHGFWGTPGGTLAVLLGKLFRIPSVVSLMGGEPACIPSIRYGNMRRQPLKGLTLWTCHQAGVLTALTRFQLAMIRGFGLRRDDVRIIPLGPEDLFIHNRDTGKRTPPFHILNIGYLNKVKDQATLLKAFAIICRTVDCRLRIIGEDFLSGEVQRTADALGVADRVEFLGYVPQPELPEQYRWADFLLHTSLYEAQGVVIAEAAASGVVICGTNVGLIADLGDQSAVAVEVGADEALADAVLRLIGNPALCDQFRKNALQWAGSHTAAWTATQFTEIYEGLEGL